MATKDPIDTILQPELNLIRAEMRVIESRMAARFLEAFVAVNTKLRPVLDVAKLHADVELLLARLDRMEGILRNKGLLDGEV